MKTINIYNYTNTDKADSNVLGSEVYKRIEPEIIESLNEGEKFVIDFTNITYITTKFLNNAIGNLFLNIDIDIDKLIKNISFSGLEENDINILKWSLNRAIDKGKNRKNN